MFSFTLSQGARKGWLTALAAAALSVAMTGCNTSTRTSTLPQSHTLAGFDDFDTAGERAPSAKTMYRLAELFEAQNRLPQAEAMHASTIERYPKFSPAYSELASIQMRTDRLDDAIATLRKGIAMQPNDPVLHNNLGMCMLVAKDYKAAHECCNTAWKLAPDSTRYAANTALALGMLGRTEEARLVYEQVMPSNGASRNITIIQSALGIDPSAATSPSSTNSLTKSDPKSTTTPTTGASSTPNASSTPSSKTASANKDSKEGSSKSNTSSATKPAPVKTAGAESSKKE